MSVPDTVALIWLFASAVLVIWVYVTNRSMGTELWNALVPDLLQSDALVDGLEAAGLVEVCRDASGNAVELLYRGKDPCGRTDVAEFLLRYAKPGPEAAA